MNYNELVEALSYKHDQLSFRWWGNSEEEVTEPLKMEWVDPLLTPPTLEASEIWSAEIKLIKAKQEKKTEILLALSLSDLWVVRHVEDGVSLTNDRRVYREALRVLLGQIDISSDPSSLVLPEVPVFNV